MLFWVKTMRNNNRLRKYVPSLLLFLLFETVETLFLMRAENKEKILFVSFLVGNPRKAL